MKKIEKIARAFEAVLVENYEEPSAFAKLRKFGGLIISKAFPEVVFGSATEDLTEIHSSGRVAASH